MSEYQYWLKFANDCLDIVYEMVDENKDLKEEDKIDIKDTLADVSGALGELKLYIGGVADGDTKKVNESEGD